MKVIIIEEAGYYPALFGIGLSYGLTSELDYIQDTCDRRYDWSRLDSKAKRLARAGGSHAKFMESMQVWLDIDAPRYWWQQFDAYRIGVTKQSESTMHTITKRHLTQDDFSGHIFETTLSWLNRLIDNNAFFRLKKELSEGFLQRREVNTNYKSLANMYHERKNHRLEEWSLFCDALQNLNHWGLIRDYGNTIHDTEAV